MRLNATKSRRQSDDDNLIPLINVVFLMLIFFMVAGQIRKSDSLNVQLPKANIEIQAEDSPVRINVLSDARIYLNQEALSVSELSARLKLLTAPLPQPVTVRVQIDADLLVSELSSVFDAIRRAGLNRIWLVTEFSGEG
ncbi:MAG: biopolymer transporter ExbD [Hahellaceae bacterium]|nr:biopolymer transporter ExbD [Hahellaceae bacterium]MCP5169803.1 biopolymer transporter ExbD [Hahellaceae bacterium]